MTVRLMTNIDQSLYDFIDREAKSKSTSKRNILEGIISEHIEKQKQISLERQYAQMGTDSEYLDEMVDNTTYLGTI